MGGEGAATITTVGEGQAAGTPDSLRLHVTVLHRAGSVSAALAGCASRQAAAVEVARRFTEPHRIGSTGLHFYTLNRSKATREIFEALRITV